MLEVRIIIGSAGYGSRTAATISFITEAVNIFLLGLGHPISLLHGDIAPFGSTEVLVLDGTHVILKACQMLIRKPL